MNLGAVPTMNTLERHVQGNTRPSTYSYQATQFWKMANKRTLSNPHTVLQWILLFNAAMAEDVRYQADASNILRRNPRPSPREVADLRKVEQNVSRDKANLIQLRTRVLNKLVNMLSVTS